MGYESLEFESLTTLEVVLSRALKTEKEKQFKKDIDHEYKRVLRAMGK